MAAALHLDAATERVAVNLLRHLEWQPDGFSLTFLFADVGPSLQLADWLDERLALQGQPLHRQHAKDAFVKQPEAEVDVLMAALPEMSARPGATWFQLQRHPSDAQWNRSRRLFLARLNERRFLLERDLQRPLVLVLPADFRSEARAIAPDIWHVRALSEELRAAAPAAAPASAEPRSAAAPVVASGAATPVHDEYQRTMIVGADRTSLATALAATRELLQAGRPADAQQVAEQTLALALTRYRAATPATDRALRNLSIALDNVGDVARAQGEWAGAEAAYRESLGLARQLVERLGGTPEALRDLSVSLDKVGDVARAQGEWAGAEAAYRESLGLRRQLVERLGGTPEALRDLSVSLNKVGNVARAQGEWAGAEAAYRESLGLSRELVERLGGTPEALRDLSVSLDNVGDVARAQGEWAGAEAAYRESLGLRRQLGERLGGTPEALRDLSVSLDNIGDVAQSQGEWAGAEAAYRESLGLSRQLVERLGGTPEALRDLSVSLNKVGNVARAQGEWASAEAAYRESLGLRRQLVERLGGTPEGRRDLSVSLNNVGDVALAQGEWAGAEAAYRESLGLARQLVERLGGTPQSLDDLGVSLMKLQAVKPEEAALRDEATRIYEQLTARYPDVARFQEGLAFARGDNASPATAAGPPDDSPNS